ncbi:MAG: hypothetical protein U0271_35645 [Polyangiaceae bacterium]
MTNMNAPDLHYCWTRVDVEIMDNLDNVLRGKHKCHGYGGQCGSDRDNGAHVCMVTPYGIGAFSLRQKRFRKLPLPKAGDMVVIAQSLTCDSDRITRFGDPAGSSGLWTTVDLPKGINTLGDLCKKLIEIDANQYPRTWYTSPHRPKLLFDHEGNSAYRAAVIKDDNFDWSMYQNSPEDLPIQAKTGEALQVVYKRPSLAKLPTAPNKQSVYVPSGIGETTSKVKEYIATVSKNVQLLRTHRRELRTRQSDFLAPLGRLRACSTLANMCANSPHGDDQKRIESASRLSNKLGVVLKKTQEHLENPIVGYSAPVSIVGLMGTLFGGQSPSKAKEETEQNAWSVLGSTRDLNGSIATETAELRRLLFTKNEYSDALKQFVVSVGNVEFSPPQIVSVGSPAKSQGNDAAIQDRWTAAVTAEYNRIVEAFPPIEKSTIELALELSETLAFAVEELGEAGDDVDQARDYNKIWDEAPDTTPKSIADIKGDHNVAFAMALVSKSVKLGSKASSLPLALGKVSDLFALPGLSRQSYSILSDASLTSEARSAQLQSIWGAFIADRTKRLPAVDSGDAAKVVQQAFENGERDAEKALGEFIKDGYAATGSKPGAFKILAQIGKILAFAKAMQTTPGFGQPLRVREIIDLERAVISGAEVTIGTVEVVLKTIGNFPKALGWLKTAGKSVGFAASLLACISGVVHLIEAYRRGDELGEAKAILEIVGGIAGVAALVIGGPVGAVLEAVALGVAVALGAIELKDVVEDLTAPEANKLCRRLLEDIAGMPEFQATLALAKGQSDPEKKLGTEFEDARKLCEDPEQPLPLIEWGLLRRQHLRDVGFTWQQIDNLLSDNPNITPSKIPDGPDRFQ